MVKQTTRDYGGLNVVFFGDPRQMGPIFDDWIFEADKKHPCGAIVGDVLFKSFESFTLDEIMRQNDLAYIEGLNDLSNPSSSMKIKSVNLFKSREIKELDLNYPPNCRVDYFRENKDVDRHNIETLDKLSTEKYDVEVELHPKPIGPNSGYQANGSGMHINFSNGIVSIHTCFKL